LDVSIVYGGVSTGVAGTSCAAPTFSGIVSLLNDVRLLAGKSALGFLNPLFYGHPEVFTDITQGNNPGCNTPGFYASAGWVR
jgi:tripeptidyl-peptidase I